MQFLILQHFWPHSLSTNLEPTFQKRSPYVKEFNKHIRLMIEMGLIKKWMESSLGQADKCSNLAKILKSHERKEVVLNLRETGTFFFLALCGTVVTVLLFGAEIAMGKHEGKQTERGTSSMPTKRT